MQDADRAACIPTGGAPGVHGELRRGAAVVGCAPPVRWRAGGGVPARRAGLRRGRVDCQMAPHPPRPPPDGPHAPRLRPRAAAPGHVCGRHRPPTPEIAAAAAAAAAAAEYNDGASLLQCAPCSCRAPGVAVRSPQLAGVRSGLVPVRGRGWDRRRAAGGHVLLL
eukprot:scaffold1273_cov401-Prasinococcus_capsulatus_cf.AAC.3